MKATTGSDRHPSAGRSCGFRDYILFELRNGQPSPTKDYEQAIRKKKFKTVYIGSGRPGLPYMKTDEEAINDSVRPGVDA